MRNLILIFAALFSISLQGQIENDKKITGQLTLKSTTHGVLFNRLTTTERDAIVSPVESEWIYNTTANEFQQYDGATWTAIGGGGGVNMADADLTLTSDRSHNLNTFDLDFFEGTYTTRLTGRRIDLGGSVSVAFGAYTSNTFVTQKGGITFNTTGTVRAVLLSDDEFQHTDIAGNKSFWMDKAGSNFNHYLYGSTGNSNSDIRFFTNNNGVQLGFNFDGNINADFNVRSNGTGSDVALLVEDSGSADVFQVQSNGRLNIKPMTAVTASALTGVEGDLVFVSTTDATFTSIGFWGFENGAWAKL